MKYYMCNITVVERAMIRAKAATFAMVLYLENIILKNGMVATKEQSSLAVTTMTLTVVLCAVLPIANAQGSSASISASAAGYTGTSSGFASSPSPTMVPGSAPRSMTLGATTTAYGSVTANISVLRARGLSINPYHPGVPYTSGTPFIPCIRNIASKPSSSYRPPSRDKVYAYGSGNNLPYSVLFWGYFRDPHNTDGYVLPDVEYAQGPECYVNELDAQRLLVYGVEHYLNDDMYEGKAMLVALFNDTTDNGAVFDYIRSGLLNATYREPLLISGKDSRINMTYLHEQCKTKPGKALSVEAIVGIGIASLVSTLLLLCIVGLFVYWIFVSEHKKLQYKVRLANFRYKISASLAPGTYNN